LGDAAPPQRPVPGPVHWSEQLRLMFLHADRSPLPVVLVDMLLAWLVAGHGRQGAGVAWVVISAVLQLLRRRLSRQSMAELQADPPPSEHQVHRVRVKSEWFSGLLGVARGASVLLLFFGAPIEALSLGTMVTVCLSAGAVASFAGLTRAHTAWNAPVFAALAVVWAQQGQALAITMAVLLVLQFLMLSAHVKDQSSLVVRTVNLAHELKQERDRARAASESKTRFFAAASHDLRQPLHALSINTTTLEVMARRAGDPLMRELSHNIGRALRQSNSLLDSLLDISLLEANVVPVNREPVDAKALLQGLCDEFVAAAAQRGLTLEVNLPQVPAHLDTDPKQIRRLLGNLLSNAIKFTAEGGVTLRLTMPESAGGPATISVIDTGSGIAADEHERVFEDFYQVGNPSRDRAQGLGLGLSIVRRTAELLGVRVRLLSRPGKGARFDVEVPTCMALQLPPTADALADAQHEGPANGLWLDAAVLAIDDEVEILESLAVMLPHVGCRVRCATSLAAAMAIVDGGFRPHVLLVDHRLPGSSSADVIAALRERLGPIPALVVTGDTAPRDLRRLLAAGARVLHKPLDGAQLAQAIQQAIAASTV
jgi:signal transduction histidine kinase